jgi:hypothetical protein
MIDMALLSVLRRWHFREGMPIREITRRTGLSRNTVRKLKAVKKVGRFGKLSQLNPELFDANFRKFTVKFKSEDLRF